MPWKCPVCGYENPDDANFCLRCGAQKPAQPTIEPMQQPVQQPDTSTQQQTQQQPEQVMASQQPATTTPDQSQVPPPTMPPQPTQDQQAQPEQQVALNPPPSPQPVAQQVVTQPQQEMQPPPPTMQPQIQQKYYLLFIQTPYAGLINQKVPLNFDIFPSVSIGRSPENVIIVPDPEVSRRHATISFEGGELYIEDLNSTNGTYVYDGKLFQPVKGKQKITPNSIIKLGNQTIVKLVTE